MPILGSSNSASNERHDVKNMDEWGYSYLIEEKTLWEKEKLLDRSNFSFTPQCFQKLYVDDTE